MLKLRLLFILFFTLIYQTGYSQVCVGDFGEVIYQHDFGKSPSNKGNGILVQTKPNDLITTYKFGTRYGQGSEHFWITNNPKLAWVQFLFFPGDHTTNGVADADGNTGNMLVFDASALPGVYFEKEIEFDVCPGNRYEFSAYLANIWPSGLPGVTPNVTFQILDGDNNIIAAQSTGNIPANKPNIIWRKYSIQFDAPLVGRRVKMRLINHVNANTTAGNDLAIDDIELKACHPGTFDFTAPKTVFCVGEGTTFSTEDNGYKNPHYQWQYKDDKGIWQNIIGATQKTYDFVAQSNSSRTYRVGIGNVSPDVNPECSAFSNPKNIVINEMPTLDLGQDITDCGEHTLMANGEWGSTYKWYKIVNGVEILIDGETSKKLKVTESGTYKSAINSDAGCNISRQVQVVIKPNPEYTITANPLGKCQDSKTEITITQKNITDKYTYQWYKNGTLITPTTSRLTVTEAGLYKVIITNEMGCAKEESITVDKVDIPTVNLGMPVVACDNYTLTAEGTGTWFEWYKVDKGVETLIPNQKEKTLNVTQSGTYKVIAHNITDCIAISEVDVVINSLPNFSINFNTEFCANEIPVLSPKNENPAQQLKYEWFLASEKTAEGNDFTPTKAGNYTIKATNQFGCTAEKSFNITINDIPTVTVPINYIEICKNNSTTLEAKSQENTFIWKKNGVILKGENTNLLNNVTEAGEYLVYAVNVKGCLSNPQKINVVVNPLPDINIHVTNQINNELQQYEICRGSSVDANVVFNFGEKISWTKKGSTEVLSNTNDFKITQTGEYTVTVTSASQCQSSKKITVTVNDLPEVKITGEPEICQGFSTTLLANVTGNNQEIKYQWLLQNADGTFDALNNQSNSQTVKNAGKYKVIVWNKNGCTHEDIFEVKVNPQPMANFTPKLRFLYDDFLFDFGNETEYLGNKDDLTYEWDFGDGSPTVATKNPKHRYKTPQDYTVKLKVTSIHGCVSEIERTIQILDGKSPNSFFRTESTCGSHVVKFYDESITSLRGTAIVTWEWDFGDGTTANEQNPIHTYATTGDYDVKLIVKDEDGRISSNTSGTVRVSLGDNPVADFNDINPICESHGIALTDKSTINFGNIISWEWDFGDGNIITKFSPATFEYQYTSHGLKKIKLTVKTKQGCENTIEKTVMVYENPEANFNIASNVCLNKNITLDNIGNANVVKWTWNMGDGSLPIEKTNNNAFQYLYNNAGVKNIILTTTSANGCKESVLKRVVIYDLPAPFFKVSSQVACLGNSISINNIKAKNIVKWTWDFGEGANNFSNKDFTYTFETIGNHSIKLSVQSENGCTNTFEIPIVITAIPKAKFDYEKKYWMVNDAVKFNQLSTVEDNRWDVISFHWDYGDGNSSNLQFPEPHIYANMGNYKVTLTTTNAQGCATTFTQDIKIYSYPVAKFKVNINGNCVTEPFIFTDESISGNNKITKLEWYYDLGRNNTPNETKINPLAGQTYNHIYPDIISTETEKTIKLTIYTETGHSASYEQKITLYPIPEVAFAPLPEICYTGGVYKITEAKELKKLEGTGVFSGKGVSPDGIFNPLKTGSIGNYEITYTFTSKYGCTDSKTQTITVLPTPSANLPEEITVFEKDNYTLQPNYSRNIIAYRWSPDIGIDNASSPYPTINLDQDRTYEISMTSSMGCIGVNKVKIIVYKEITVPNAFSPNGDGINDVWNIENLKKYGRLSNLKLYNRLGQLVFTCAGYDKPWDGTNNGEPLPLGTYFYVITKEIGKKQFAGSVSIIK